MACGGRSAAAPRVAKGAGGHRILPRRGSALIEMRIATAGPLILNELLRTDANPSVRVRATTRHSMRNAFGGRHSSFRLNVQLADHLAEILEFLSEKSSEFRATNARRVKRQGNELRLDLGHVQGRMKPSDEPSKRFLR